MTVFYHTSTNNQLNKQDFEKLSESWITEEFAETSVIFRVDSQQGAEIVGRKPNSGNYAGIVFTYKWPGEDSPRQFRVRLDSPKLEYKADGTLKETGKYLSAPGARNILYIPIGTPPSYLNDTSIEILLTEGEKKAISLYRLSIESDKRWLVIGLSGVWNWKGTVGKTPAAFGGYRDVKGTIPDFDKINFQGRLVTICFDRNVWTNESVKAARKQLAAMLIGRGAKVRFVDIPIEETEINGIDDLLFKLGSKPVLELIENARLVESLQAAKKVSRPKGSIIADVLTEQYQNRLSYDASVKMWRIYTGNKWEVIEAEIVRKQVQKDAKHHYENTFNYLDGYEDTNITSIMALLKTNLTVVKWEQKPNLLPLQNGVLDLNTMELKPHSPTNYITWQLPYSYDPLAKCKIIIDWLLEITHGDWQILQFIRAFLRATLLGRVDLQIYLEMIGFGGSGKGTLIRLVTALIGVINTTVTDLENLETNRFETAKLYGKRLAIITDADQYSRSLRVLKQITGQDRVRAEKKGKDAFDFTPECMVIVAANEAIQTTDTTSGVARRKRTIAFDKHINALNRRNLVEETRDGFTGEFVEFLPGLLNWVLEMTDQEMIQAIHNSYEQSPLMKQTKIENLLSVNPIASWFDENVSIDPKASVKVGLNTNDETQALYPNYCKFTLASGSKPLSVKRFSAQLEDLCIAQLELQVSKKRTAEGAFFFGIRLKQQKDNAYSISDLIIDQYLIDEVSMRYGMRYLVVENDEFIENEVLSENSSLENKNEDKIGDDNSNNPNKQSRLESQPPEKPKGEDASNSPLAGSKVESPQPEKPEGEDASNNPLADNQKGEDDKHKQVNAQATIVEQIEKNEAIPHKPINSSYTTIKTSSNTSSIPHRYLIDEVLRLESEPHFQLNVSEVKELVTQARQFVAQGLHKDLPLKICVGTALEQFAAKKWLPIFLNEINSQDIAISRKAIKEVCKIFLAIKQHLSQLSRVV